MTALGQDRRVVGSSAGDDRILPLTRVVAVAVIAILALGFGVLFLLPDETETRFAWTIEPTFTAMLMGAGYGSAIVFFVRVASGTAWRRVELGFLATIAFAWLMTLATVLHWDRFHHGTTPFRLWWWVYVAASIAVPAVWWVNRRRRMPYAGTPIPRAVRAVLIGAGVALAAVAGWLYLAPVAAIEAWPWSLTPLTSRAVASFVALPAVAWLAVAIDGRWEPARAVIETVWLGIALLLIAVARAWGQFDRTNPLAWIYVGGLVLALAALSALWVTMRGRVHAGY